MKTRKVILTFLILTTLCFSIASIANADTAQTVTTGYYNVESGKMEIGTAKLMQHSPSGSPEIIYNVIDERTYKRNTDEVPDKVREQLKAIADTTNEVFDKGINYSGTAIQYGNFGRVDSNAWSYSLTIAPLVVPMLEERYGMKADDNTWLCLCDKKGHVIRVYMEIVESPTVEVRLHEDGAYIFGRDDVHMRPNEPTQRQEACAMLYRLLKQNDATGSFSAEKTTADYWSKNAMDYMCYIGMYDSLPNLEEEITRGEAFKLFCISLGYTDQRFESVDFYAEILQNKGYVVGDESGRLNLNHKITRAEFCKIYNMIIGRDKMTLLDVDGNTVTAEYYGIIDLDESEWYYDVMLKATSSYDGKKIDRSERISRNEVDDY